MLLFEVGLPNDKPLGGKLTVTVGSGSPIITATKAGDVVVRGPQLVGNHGDAVHAEFVYVKSSGRPSGVPAVADAVLVDVFPAPNPGPITINVYAEQ